MQMVAAQKVTQVLDVRASLNAPTSTHLFLHLKEYMTNYSLKWITFF